MSTADAKLDPTAKTLNQDLTPQQKIDGKHLHFFQLALC
jgi:hypothetical protein